MREIEEAERASKAYSGGVTMGSELLADANRAPSFIAWVARDPNSAPLQRVQIIKGWVENGESQEAVYDVACSDGGIVDPVSHRCPDNGAQVNLADCRISSGLGAAELKARWQDPEYDATQNAFYYLRAMENPSCRWSTWDAIRAGVEPRSDLAATIQERVWSSPIWITPVQ